MEMAIYFLADPTEPLNKNDKPLAICHLGYSPSTTYSGGNGNVSKKKYEQFISSINNSTVCFKSRIHFIMLSYFFDQFLKILKCSLKGSQLHVY